ncbi:MAG: EamA family transporter [Firmicutes bacterium HGW-Firmicutes-16]|nr:MAG: EamA family transporter [Firmicutes bacterium HGW-Firmicutes-16]
MKNQKGPLYLFLAFTLAGTSVVSARFVSDSLGTFTIALISLFFALMFLIPISGKRLFTALLTLNAKEYLLMSVQALFGIFLFRMFLLKGLTRTSAGEAGILTGATPAITALLAVILLKEHLNYKKLLGIIGTVAGILLIQNVLGAGSGFTSGHFWGNMLVLCAAACESLFNTFSRFFALRSLSNNTQPVHPLVQTTIVSAFALILCLIPALFEHPVTRLSAIGTVEWLALIWYGVFVTALAFICWYGGINRSGALTAAAFSGMMPFTSTLLSVTVLGEKLDLQQWVGAALIVICMLLIGTDSAIDSRSGNLKTVQAGSSVD